MNSSPSQKAVESFAHLLLQRWMLYHRKALQKKFEGKLIHAGWTKKGDKGKFFSKPVTAPVGIKNDRSIKPLLEKGNIPQDRSPGDLVLPLKLAAVGATPFPDFLHQPKEAFKLGSGDSGATVTLIVHDFILRFGGDIS